MLDKINKLIADMNAKGIPVPLARDPKSGRGSLTFTMAIVSFGACLVLLAGKAADKLGGIDYDNALWLLGLTLSTYVGRQYQKVGKQVTISGETQETTQAPKAQGGSDDAGSSK